MKFKWDVRRIILLIMIAMFCIIILWPDSLSGSEKRCNSDEDCTFVRTVCCPGCDKGIESVNVRYSEKITADINARCTNTTCPPLFCTSDFGSGVISAPACVKGKCTAVDKLECSAVCDYYKKSKVHPFNIYLKNLAEYENKTISNLALDCGC